MSPLSVLDAPPDPRRLRASDPRRLRASDAEREDAVTALHAALVEGRLDLAETETRVTVAYASRHRDELPPLLSDLPRAAGPSGDRAPAAGEVAPTWARLWADLVRRLRSDLGRTATPTPARLHPSRRLAVVLLTWVLLLFLLGLVL